MRRFVVQLAVCAEQLHGQGPALDASVNYSHYSKSVAARLHRSLFPRQADPVRRQHLSAGLQQLQLCRRTTATRPTRSSAPAADFGSGFPVTEYWSFGEPLLAESGQHHARRKLVLYGPGRHGTACPPSAIRSRPAAISATRSASALTSLVGFSTIYDDTDGIHPTRGQRLTFSQDFAGLGGDVRYLRTRADATKYTDIGGGWILSAHAEGGYHHGAPEIAGAGPRSPSGSPTASSARSFAASTSAASGPVSSAFAYDADGNLDPLAATIIDQRRAWRQGLLYGSARA